MEGRSLQPSTSYSSQDGAKRQRKNQTSTHSHPKRRKKDNGRFLSDSNPDMDELYNTHLSAEMRDTVLKLKRIKDPFSEEIQEVVETVFDHFDQQAGGEIDLAESALLLSSVTSVYSAQVKCLHEEVMTYADLLNGKSAQKRKRKKHGEDDKDDEGNSGKVGDKPQSENVQISDEEAENDTLNDSGICVDDTIVNPDATLDANPTDNLGGENERQTNPENAGVEDSTTTVEDENATPTEQATQLETQILNEIPSRCTRRQSERIKSMLNLEKERKERDYTLKKRKYDEDPPDLFSCDDELKTIEDSDSNDLCRNDECPPTLEIQGGKRRKKMNNDNDDIDDNNDFSMCQNEDVPEPTPGPSSGLLSSVFTDPKYETLDHLPNDVQQKFHDLIQDMHALPFDYGLMQNDMFKAYQQKFLQAVNLLSQNSVLVKPKEAEQPKPVELNDSQVSEGDQTISTIAELLNQVRQQAAEEYIKDNKSKSSADVPVSQMIATLKKIICSRYKKWHVRTDSDQAVFKRIKEFEDKVKAVLQKEAEQGMFDVKKYEMEVMDVTLKESQDADFEDIFLSPLSPVAPEGAQSPGPGPEDNRNWILNASSRRSSMAGSVDGSGSWMSLVDIFSHMKKIDHSETCRHFYAVLALLSHKSLSINYDNLYSKESAKLITKIKKNRKDTDVQNKYPEGAKIMTSRCPDLERDEVLLAPVFTAEAIQQALEQNGYMSPSREGSSYNINANGYMQSQTIADAISQFVPDPGQPYEEELFSTRKRKK